MRRVLAAVGVLLVSTTAGAQTIDGYQVRYYFTGGLQPFQTWPITAAQVRCDQTPEGVPGLRNPIGIEWNDPDRPGRACQYRRGNGRATVRVADRELRADGGGLQCRRVERGEQSRPFRRRGRPPRPWNPR